jgi:nucleotide-binding universal stress UspA family protein
MECDLEMHFGSAAEEIGRVAAAVDPTIVVVDAAAHRRPGRGAAGARALQLLRRVGCPVLSVAFGRAALPRRAVVGVDFSPASIRAAQAALLLLDDRATVRFAHVAIQTYSDQPVREPSGAILGGDAIAEFDRLRAELAPYLTSDGTVETRVLAGSVVDELLFEADAAEADLLAVGTHGPGFVERLFVGSVAAGVVHHAPCSALVAPNPAPAEYERLSRVMSEPAPATPSEDVRAK